MDRKFFIGLVYSLVSLLLAVPMVHGQQGVVHVQDAKTADPVAFAHVCFFPLDGGLQVNGMTDEEGNAVNLSKVRSEVAVTYVGYETLRDTIEPGQNMILSLAPSIQDINEVVVTAQYAPKRVDQSIYKVKVIGSLQIEQQAATNLPELLSTGLNIRISQNGALGTGMSMQGLRGEHIKFLIDGVPVIGRMNGNIDISQLNLYNVDHIEIIEGPMSVVYGSNALAGVINIITKENQNTTLNANANSYVESVGTYNFDGGLSYRKKRHTISFSGGRNFFSGYSLDDSVRSVRWKPKRQYFTDAYYLFSELNYKAKISGSYFNEKLENKGDLQWPYFETALDSYFYTTRATGKVEASSKWKSDRYLSVIGSYSFYQRQKETYFVDLTQLSKVLNTSPENTDTTRFHNIMSRVTFSKSRQESKLNYQLGLDMNWETGEGRRITDQKQSIGDYAAFLSVEYAPTKNLTFQPGIRAIYNTKYAAPLIWSFNVRYSFLNHYIIRGSVARGFRAPSLKELYLYFVDVNHNIQGNEELGSENSYNANLDFSYARETANSFVSADVKFFYNYINNSIILAVVDPDEQLWTYENLVRYITQGAQFTCNYRLYPQLNIRAGAGITGSHNSLSEDAEGFKDFYYSPDATASVNYRWMKYDIEFNADYKYTGKLPRVFEGSDGELYEGYISAYNTLDFNIGKKLFKDMISLSAGVKNVFNVISVPSSSGFTGEAHSGSGDGTQPIGYGRTYFVRLSFNFRKI